MNYACRHGVSKLRRCPYCALLPDPATTKPLDGRVGVIGQTEAGIPIFADFGVEERQEAECARMMRL